MPDVDDDRSMPVVSTYARDSEILGRKKWKLEGPRMANLWGFRARKQVTGPQQCRRQSNGEENITVSANAATVHTAAQSIHPAVNLCEQLVTNRKELLVNHSI